MKRNNKSCANISANAAYLILVNQFTYSLGVSYTLNQIKSRVEEHMDYLRRYSDSYTMDNGDEITFYNGRWYYDSYTI